MKILQDSKSLMDYLPLMSCQVISDPFTPHCFGILNTFVQFLQAGGQKKDQKWPEEALDTRL